MSWCCQPPNDLPLTATRYLAIAQKGRQHLLVSKVLVPRLQLLGGLANRLTEPDERVSEAVRVEIRQPGAGKGFSKDGADSRGAAPVSPFQPHCFELACRPQRNAGRGEERIVIALKHFLLEKRDPLRHNAANIIPGRKEKRGERLTELGLDLTRILLDAVCGEIDMF